MNKNKNKNKIKLFAAPYIAAKALPVLNTQITSSRLQSNFSTVKNTTAAAFCLCFLQRKKQGARKILARVREETQQKRKYFIRS